MTAPASEREPDSVLEQLPGDLMMWVLIASEPAVFGAGLADASFWRRGFDVTLGLFVLLLLGLSIDPAL